MDQKQIELTPEQQGAVGKIVDWYKGKGKQTLSCGGFAGTGKTTIIKEVINRLDQDVVRDHTDEYEPQHEVGICAFTGKAVSVLRKKGLSDAQTMHSMMYTCYEDEKTHEMIFEKKVSLPFDLIIVDEASMVSRELNNDLISFGKPVLYVGDPGQLEPVGDNPGIMNQPEILLTKIHRQAEQSRIIQQSIRVRGANHVEYQKNEEIWCAPRADIPQTACLEVDQVICGQNKTRQAINAQMREALGFKGHLNVGEKLICLRNDRKLGIFNGQMFKVLKINQSNFDKVICADLEDDLGVKYPNMRVLINGLNETFDPKRGDKLPWKTGQFTYGYCITCHKSQGSEWDSVLVFEQNCPLWSMSKWRYTAITRAAKRLIYVR